MPAPATCDAFVDMLHKSGLLEPERLTRFFTRLVADGQLPDELHRLAAKLVRDGLLTNFQAQQLLKGRYRNFTIGKYRVLEPLGAGGMSKVFLVEHRTMGHRVAMKLLPIGPHEETSLVQRFKREAKAVGALNHPNIVRAHDIDEAEKYHYIIMDYIDGVNLHDLVRKRGPLDPIVAAHYIAQAAAGLQHVYETGLIHRDVKPGNLLVDRDGVVKILDLGLARFQHDTTDLITQKFDDDAILGTADYLAPEQALKSSNVDIRADIYGLGATFYFLLAGRAPFENEKSITQKLMGHQMRPPDALANLRPKIPADMIAVCETMLAKAPERRYQTPIEIVNALAPWTATPISPPAEDDLPRRSPVSQAAPSFAGPNSRLKPPTSAIPIRSSGPESDTPAPEGLPPRSASGLSATPVPRRPRPMREPDLESILPETARLLSLAAAAMLLVCILGAGLWWWQPWSPAPATAVESSSKEEPKPPPEPAPKPPPPEGPLFVDELGGVNTFTSVSAALAAARPGDRILVKKSIQDSVVFTDQSKTNVSIEPADPGAAITWSPASGNSVKPLLIVRGCAGLRVSGFKFDGQGKVDDLIVIEGACSGCQFERLEFGNCKRAGIHFKGIDAVGGSADQPLKIAGCRFVPGHDSASGVVFDSAKANEYIAIEDNRFEGPALAGVAVGGPTLHVEFRANRFFETNSGVLYNPVSDQPPFNIGIENNTFCRVQRALGFDTLPREPGSKLTIVNNLFLEVRHIAMLSDLTLAPADTAAQWIWTNEGPASDETAAPPKAPRYFRHSIELPSPPTRRTTLDIGADDSFAVWLNGTKVGESGLPHFTGRIYSFEVAPVLRPGRNAIAVEAVNQQDFLEPTRGTPAGLLVQLTDRSGAKPHAITISDSYWKSAKSAPDGWYRLEFDETSWPPARPTLNGADRPWLHVTWDGEVRRQLEAKGLKPLELVVAGNVRDYTSWEGWPLLDSMRGFIDSVDKPILSRNPADANFLLYPRGHALQAAGADRRPCGVPPR